MGLMGLMGLLLLVFADVYFHADEGIVFGEVYDIVVAQADASFAGASGNGIVVAGAAVDANAGPFEIAFQPEEPFAVGRHGPATVVEIVFPICSVVYFGDIERLSVVAFGCAAVAFLVFVAEVGSEAYWIGCYERCAGAADFVDVESAMLFGYLDIEVVRVVDIGIDDAVVDGCMV